MTTNLALRHATKRVVTDTVDIGRLHEQNINAYLDETLELTDRLRVNAAVRADLFVFDFRGRLADSSGTLAPLGGRVNAARVSPKLNFYYQASPAVQLFVRSGLGFHSNDARGVVRGANTGPGVAPRHRVPNLAAPSSLPARPGGERRFLVPAPAR